MHASQQGHKVTVQALLEVGAHRSIRDKVATLRSYSCSILIVQALHCMVTVAEQQDRRRMGQDP
jgi:hypothetical protein